MALILAGIMWTGNSLVDMNEEVAIVNVKLANLEDKFDNVYTFTEATKDTQFLNLKISNLDNRIVQLEQNDH